MKLYLSFISLIFVLVSPALSEPILTINTAASSPYTRPDMTGLADRIILEAFKRIGYEIKIVSLPSERALINANAGIEDGNFVRVAGLNKLYPNLIMVPEKITENEFVVFTKSAFFEPIAWESLQPYNVAIIRGWKILEKNITGTKSLIKVKNQKLLFTHLDKNRSDIIVYERYRGYEIIQRLGLKGIVALEPPLAVKDMFLYLHKKHEKLIPQLVNKIKEMKKEGTFEKIVQETLRNK